MPFQKKETTAGVQTKFSALPVGEYFTTVFDGNVVLQKVNGGAAVAVGDISFTQVPLLDEQDVFLVLLTWEHA